MKRRFTSRSMLTAAALVAFAALPGRSAENTFTALPENPTTLTVLRAGQPYMDVQFNGWGPNWSWMGFRGSIEQQGSTTQLICNSEVASSGATIKLAANVTQVAPRRLKMDIDLSATKATDLTYIVVSLTPATEAFDGGSVRVSKAGGKPQEVKMPLGKRELGTALSRFTLVDAVGSATDVSLDPPCDVPADNSLRIVLAAEHLAPDSPNHKTLTLSLPGSLVYYAGAEAVPADPTFDQWYPFRPSDDYTSPTEIGMQDWLEKPAGKHGRIQRDGARLTYDGRPIKLWGLNLCYSACAPEKELAEKRAHFYAQYGVNSVRLHKFVDGSGWSGIQSADSCCEFDPDALDRMDYQVAQFKEQGIYVKLSAHFGSQKLGPADKKYVPYLEEFGTFDGRKNRIATPHSAIHYSRELQAVQIRQMVNVLRHKNPYTGLTYAEDPAIAFIEIINEQSILFFTSMNPLKASATLRRDVAGRFCQWLRKRYQTHGRLEKAWGGPDAFDSFTEQGFPAVGEHLDKDNILPLGNPWYWDPQQLTTSLASHKQRMLDTLLFLYELQCEFYHRYVEAVRAAGYDGEFVSSNWQAGRALSHFYNLHSDAMIGTVDRHNYFGGGSKSRINNATMLARPGSGILSSGMQQVAGHPFMLSEWIHVTPTEWGVEGPAIIGAYGMGLQGWDVSYMFQNRDNGQLSDTIGRDRWDVTAPNVMGVFPAVSRQVLRGDVQESTELAPVYVHVPSLHEGKLGFEDRVTQQYDVKTFESDKVPAAALAVKRCVVQFTDSDQPTPATELAEYLRDGFYTSSTGQLRWKGGQKKLDGYFTVNTAATQAVVGFAQGATCSLSDVRIAPECRYGAIYVCAQEPDKDLATSSKWLVVAIARARNKGMKVFQDQQILQQGTSPVLMEPVRARVTLLDRTPAAVQILDHSGRHTGRMLPISDDTFTIDGARDRTCYYLVTF